MDMANGSNLMPLHTFEILFPKTTLEQTCKI